MTSPHADQIIEGYLARLDSLLAPLSAARRVELIDEVRAHIAEARERLVDETDADLLNILDRLGDPADTANAEIGRAETLSTPATGGRSRVLEVLAIVFLLLFWPVGVALLWISDVWTTRDKVIGTLVPPGGYLALFVLVPLGTWSTVSISCYTSYDSSGHVLSSTCPSGAWQVLINVAAGVVLVVLLVAPIMTAIFLGIRLRRGQKHPDVNEAIAADG